MIINLTPHTVNVMNNGETIAEFVSNGVARASQTTEKVGTIDSVDLFTIKYGEPVDLPEPSDDKFFIVSRLTAEAAKAAGRTTDDLLLTANPVRDAEGRIIGCAGFSQL